MTGGIGNVLLSTYSQTENGEDPLVFFVEPLNHVITFRGQILVSRTNDDPLLPRVYRHHAHMLKHMCAWCRHTQGRFECTHLGVSYIHTRFFPRFFSVPQHTQTHTHPTHHTTPQHTTPHGDRDRETEKEGQRKRRQDKTRKEKTRQEKRRRDKKREDKTRKAKKREDERGEKRKDM